MDPVIDDERVIDGVSVPLPVGDEVMEGDGLLVCEDDVVADGVIVADRDTLGGLEVDAVTDGPMNENVVNGRYEKPLSL